MKTTLCRRILALAVSREMAKDHSVALDGREASRTASQLERRGQRRRRKIAPPSLPPILSTRRSRDPDARLTCRLVQTLI